MAVISLTKESFQTEVIDKGGLVFVDFYAEWCSPCKMLAPIVEKLSEDFEGQIVFAKLNIDDAPDWASRYDVASIPTLILFQNGEKKDQLVGVVPQGQMEDFLKKNL